MLTLFAPQDLCTDFSQCPAYIFPRSSYTYHSGFIPKATSPEMPSLIFLPLPRNLFYLHSRGAENDVKHWSKNCPAAKMNKSENRDSAVTVTLRSHSVHLQFHRLRQEMEAKLMEGKSTQIMGQIEEYGSQKYSQKANKSNQIIILKCNFLGGV